MDRLLREANPPTGQLASPKPQYKKPGEDAYEPVEGQYGAPFAILKNASGQVISPATDAKLEQVKSELELIKSELQTIKANQLSGDQKVQLSGTIVDDEVNALRVYQASVLSADQDSVALGGEIADQIVKRPKSFTRIYQNSAVVVPPSGSIVVLDEPRYIELTYLHILSEVYEVYQSGGEDIGRTLAVSLSPYYTSLHNAPIQPIQTDGRHGGATTYIGQSYPDFWEAIVSRVGKTAGSKASSRYVGSKVFPQGVRIILSNYSEDIPVGASWMGGFYAY